VVLTSIGRRTGLPRQTLLPCGRRDGEIVVVSTYGWRSDWIRNLRKNPQVKVTRDGAEAHRKPLPRREEAASNDVVVGAVELEEKRLTRTEGAEGDAWARLPKVDFIQLTGAAQTLEPIAVGDRNERRDFASHDESLTERDKHFWLIDRNRGVPDHLG